MTTATKSRIDVEATDAVSAYRLQRRLGVNRAVVSGHGRRWHIVVDDAAGEIAEVEDVVRDWLRDVGVPETTIWVDGWPCAIGARRMRADLPLS